ncbi:PKD domain-containing protein [Candidatus Woesearchaeota archaeon]|nr:PKD domain-containing protein [Candidatus Woesearchaeota archaeon]
MIKRGILVLIIVLSTVALACNDSDNGNYFVAGECWDMFDGQGSDTCNGNELQEWYCSTEEATKDRCMTTTIRCDAGCDAGACNENSAEDTEVNVRIRISQGEPSAGIPITFVAESDEELQDHFWDFGDGSTSTKASPTHVYEKKGQYDVHVRAQSGDTIGYDELDFRIADNLAPIVTLTQTTTREGLLVGFSINAEDPEGRDIIEVSIDYGDESRDIQAAPSMTTTHQYYKMRARCRLHIITEQPRLEHRHSRYHSNIGMIFSISQRKNI